MSLVVIRTIKYFLWAVILVVLVIGLSIPLAMYGNYESLRATARLVVENNLGVTVYAIKQSDVGSVAIDSAGGFWFEIDPPVDRIMLARLRTNFVSLESTVTKGDFRYDTNGFEAFENNPILVDSADSTAPPPKIFLYVKEGDKNVFVHVYEQ